MLNVAPIQENFFFFFLEKKKKKDVTCPFVIGLRVLLYIYNVRYIAICGEHRRTEYSFTVYEKHFFRIWMDIESSNYILYRLTSR